MAGLGGPQSRKGAVVVVLGGGPDSCVSSTGMVELAPLLVGSTPTSRVGLTFGFQKLLFRWYSVCSIVRLFN